MALKRKPTISYRPNAVQAERVHLVSKELLVLLGVCRPYILLSALHPAKLQLFSSFQVKFLPFWFSEYENSLNLLSIE